MKKILFSAILFASTMSVSFAQHDIESVELNEVEVSADRTKIYSGLGRIVNVIEKAEIEKSAIRSMDDLLDYIAGVDVRQRGMFGVQSDISIRGGSFDQILVLLNGVNITDPQTGHYNLDIPLDITDVSRVEILQGSAARLLGPNAFSGAINIITGESRKKQVSVRNSAGSFGYFSQNATGNYASGNFQTFGSITHKQSKGYINNTDFDISSAFWQSKLNTKNAGLFDLQVAGQMKSFGANGFYSLKYPNQFEHTKTFFSSLGWNYQSGAWKTNAQAYWRQHHDRFELFRNFEGTENFPWYKGHNYHQTDVTGGKISVSNQWIAGNSTLGIDLRNEHIFSNVLGKTIAKPVNVPFETGQQFTKEDNRLLATVFLDHSLKIQKWYISTGAALTYNKQFGSHMNGGIDLAYELNKFSRIFTAANSAVRLPTFTDLYYQSAIQISNPNLKPEKSTTLELGIKSNPTYWTLSAVGYYRFGKNVIDWVKAPETDKWESRNWTNVNAYGLDINGEYRFQSSFIQSISGSYSFLNLDKKADGLDSKYALDYLKHKIVAGIHHRIISNFSANWNISFFDRAGNYTDFTTNQPVNYKPYVLFDGKLMWKTNKLYLFADINNILNQKYADFGGLPQPGRNFNVGIQLHLF